MRVLVLSPNTPFPSLSNWTLPVLPLMVTMVELSVVTVLLRESFAVTLTRNGTPAA